MNYADDLLAVIQAKHYTDKEQLLSQISTPADNSQWEVPPIPAQPGRPDHYIVNSKPERRRKGLHHEQTRFKFLLAIHHIEYSAIDLACLQCLRSPGMPQDYHKDFLQVAREECQHAQMLGDFLIQRGYEPGSRPIHHRLWQAALGAEDAGEQLVVIPRFLEARGLDVTAELLPRMKELDIDAYHVLNKIYQDEIGHVQRGSKWHIFWCERAGLSVSEHYQTVVRKHFQDQLPIAQDLDIEGRSQAGFLPQELTFLKSREHLS